MVFCLDSLHHSGVELVMLDHYPQSKQVSPCSVENELRLAEQVPSTISRDGPVNTELIDGDNGPS